jgi:hypothetical protein
MDRVDADGAAAAVAYFFALEQFMFTTGQASEFESMSHKACGYCDESMSNNQWLLETGSIYEGGDVDVQVLEAYVRDPVTGIFPIDVRVTTSEIVIRDSDGNLADRVGEQSNDIRAEVGTRKGEWVVVGMPAISDGDR